MNPPARRCEVLLETINGLVGCLRPAEGMDAVGVLVCRPCGANRTMVGGVHIGWFGETMRRRSFIEIARATRAEVRRSAVADVRGWLWIVKGAGPDEPTWADGMFATEKEAVASHACWLAEMERKALGGEG